ncbi:MAG: transposase [Xenococcaceae cyanobacterium MO_188.B29]|nr:transposase [Xenococcaceae cyanobacterium MO_188.B29]
MSPRKLTEEDKTQIIQLYRNSEATTSTLAEDYGVSSSTISRFLKNTLSESEYEELIQQKRLARTHKSDRQETQTIENKQDKQKTSSSSKKKVVKSTKSKSTEPIAEPPAISEPENNSVEEQPKPKEKIKLLPKLKESSPPEVEEIDEVDELDVVALGEMLGEDIDDSDEEEDYEDDWDNEADEDIAYTSLGNINVQILPISDASFPKTCYLVIDRSSELITRPLEDFADLGTIPQEEIQQKTLPVFDNHRVARRFSHRRERVIKVPDGRMLQKTSPYLEAKGITRLLIDGQIYSLSS